MSQLSTLVCIVEDEDHLREALELMLEGQPGFALLCSYKNAAEACAGIPESQPDVVLMDIHLPDDSGIACVAKLKRQFPGMLFMMCTAYDDSSRIFDSLAAGASGYILKSDGSDRILEALGNLVAGGSPMSPGIARKVVDSFNRQQPHPAGALALTERERLVLDQVAKGCMNKEVADRLGISAATVRTHIQNIYAKLHVNTRVEAVNMYLDR